MIIFAEDLEQLLDLIEGLLKRHIEFTANAATLQIKLTGGY